MDTNTLLLYGSIYGWMLLTGIGLPPVPEEAGILYAAGLSTHGQVWWPIAWLCTSLGILSADLVLYGVGRQWGTKLFELKWVQRFLKKERRERLESRFHQHGFKLLVLARFLPPLRTGVFLIAGASRYSILKFIIADVIYGIVGVGLFFLFGSFMIGLLERLHDYLRNPIVYIVGVPIILGLLYGYYRYQRVREMRVAPQAPVSIAAGAKGVVPPGESAVKPEGAPAAMAEAAKMFEE
jgi:membrane protein DedA with SNARE-associated domain